MGRVTHRYAFQGASPANLAAAIGAVTNPASTLRPFLIDEATSYDISYYGDNFLPKSNPNLQVIRPGDAHEVRYEG